MSLHDAAYGTPWDATSASDTQVDDEDGSRCTVCSEPLGKLKLNPRHHCRICERLVCSSCSPSSVQLSTCRSRLQRVCTPCVAVAEQAKSTTARLARLGARLLELSGGRAASGVQPRGGESLEEALGLCETTLGPMEEMKALLNTRVDQAESAAILEGEMRQCVFSKAQAAREALQRAAGSLRGALAASLVEAGEACEAAAAPLAELAGERACLEASLGEWARGRVDAQVRAAQEAREAAERQRGAAQEYIVSLGDVIHGFCGGVDGFLTTRPSPNATLDEATRFCDGALAALKEVVATTVKEGGGLLGQSDAALLCSLVLSKPQARSCSEVSPSEGGAVRDVCMDCGTNLGKRHMKPRHWCQHCQGLVCSGCCSQGDTCRPCTRAIQTVRPLAQRLDRLAAELRGLAAGRVAGAASHGGAEPPSLEVAVQLCEASLEPLRAACAGEGAWRRAAEAARARLDEQAEVAGRARQQIAEQWPDAEPRLSATFDALPRV